MTLNASSLLIAGVVALSLGGLTWYFAIKQSKAKPSVSIVEPCSCEFYEAADRAKRISVSDTATLLRLYGLYKRATMGKADQTSQPWEPTARAKWNAWNDCRDLSKEEAELLYVDLVKSLSNIHSTNAEPPKKASMGPKVSKMLTPEQVSAPVLEFDGFEEFERVRKDFSKLREILDAHPAMIKCCDEEKRTLLHWAFDSDDLDAVLLLVERGAEIDAKDVDGFTPLGYAASSDLVEIASFLYSAGANPTIASPDQAAAQLTSDPQLRKELQ